MEMIAAKENTMIPIPHVEKTAVVTTQMISLNYNIQVPSRFTMPRNRTETHDECNFEATLSYDPCQTGV